MSQRLRNRARLIDRRRPLSPAFDDIVDLGERIHPCICAHRRRPSAVGAEGFPAYDHRDPYLMCSLYHGACPQQVDRNRRRQHEGQRTFPFQELLEATRGNVRSEKQSPMAHEQEVGGHRASR